MFADGNDKLYDFVGRSNSSALKCDDPSLTVQDGVEDADINTIVYRFGLTGKMPENLRMPSYGDFTGVDDYRSALDLVMEAEAQFMTIPANIRARFNHDPQEFMSFVHDPANADEMISLGFRIPVINNAPNPVDVPPVSGDNGNGS